MRKILAMVLAVIMVMSLATVAFAADLDGAPECFIKAPDATDHTYVAYQIFTGKLYEHTLTELEWGSGVTEAGQTHFGVATEKAGIVVTTEQALAFANELVAGEVMSDDMVLPYLDQSASIALQAGEYVEVDPGYYLIMDVDGTVPEGHAYTLYIMQVAGKVQLQPKESYPESDKNQNDKPENYSKEPVDVNIGDKVYYELTGTVPLRLADYNTYKYVFHDTMSAGLTFNADSVKVYVKNGDTKTDVTDSFTLTVPGTDCTFEVGTDNLKNVPGVTTSSIIVVEYNATLNTNAAIGNPGEKNTSNLEFSNNPNQGGEGDTDETPEKTVYAFTFTMDLDKVDGGDQSPLEGVEFKLYNADGNYVTVDENGFVTGWTTEEKASVLISDKNGDFVVKGLDQGTYFLKETKPLPGYEPIPDKKIIIVATYGKNEKLEDVVATLNATLDGINGPVTAPFDVDAGVVTVVVQNTSGKTLPSTGGMGTTLFYVVGAVLMITASVMLVTKKRMNNV